MALIQTGVTLKREEIMPEEISVRDLVLRIDDLNIQRFVLREALKELVAEVEQWCKAVEKDASWDGWDHHYKKLAHGGLDKYKQLL